MYNGYFIVCSSDESMYEVSFFLVPYGLFVGIFVPPNCHVAKSHPDLSLTLCVRMLMFGPELTP